MRWLHLSDIHSGKNNALQKQAMKSLVGQIEELCKNGEIKEIDYVFITGDIAYSGDTSEYNEFENSILKPLHAIGNIREARVVTVPGNHDKNCLQLMYTSWEAMPDSQKRDFFLDSEEGIAWRKDLSVRFQSYEEFVNRNDILSLMPSKKVSQMITRDESLADLALANTALFAHQTKSTRDDKLPSIIDSLRELNLAKTKPTILIAHHPITDFIEEKQKAFETFLQQNNVVYLHGHLHQVKFTYGRHYLQSLGFGAVYTSGLSDNVESHYRNTFAICEVTNKLRVKTFSWDSHSGVWVNSTESDFPNCMNQNGGEKYAEFTLPIISTSRSEEKKNITIDEIRRLPPQPEGLFFVGTPSQSACEIVMQMGRYSSLAFYQEESKIVEINSSNTGMKEYELHMKNGERRYVKLIYAKTNVITKNEIEKVNTKYDTEEYCSETIITLGNMSQDAYKLYNILESKKAIEILHKEYLYKHLKVIMSTPQKEHMQRLKKGTHSISVLVSDADVYIVVIERYKDRNRFYIVDNTGEVLKYSDSIVGQIRVTSPDFATYEYLEEDLQYSNLEEFMEKEYLRKCYEENNTLKYTGLARIGFRPQEMTLEQLYIPSSASEIESGDESRTNDIVDDYLEKLPIGANIKEHLRSSILKQSSDTEEASATREYCQRYSEVLLVGDPGSGKTCFIKNEILDYCRDQLSQDTNTETTWYSKHIPVYVSLAQLVEQENFAEESIESAIAKCLQNRGLPMSTTQLVNFSIEGRNAFFFDGLDEIVSIEKRAKAVKKLNDFISEHSDAGNRYIVTSRPAAVQVVNLLPSLHSLSMQGLSDSEMSRLGRKLLGINLSEGGTNGLQIELGASRSTESITIERIIEDVKSNIGLHRLAQNPLLFTLLVMTYANSGEISAKRHRIYQEAVATLTNVRSSELPGHTPLPVQDIKSRFGEVALSIYMGDIGLLPTKDDVVTILAELMKYDDREADKKAAEAYLRKVAESTGLIAIEKRVGNDSKITEIVTFMHHSFLEYFAAVGVMNNVSRINIEELVCDPKWHEILTLLAGLMSEYQDSAEIIRQYMNAADSEELVDARILRFAMECALESDVPSEAVQRDISQKIVSCLEDGACRVDPWVRAEIGRKLGKLLEVSGGEIIEEAIDKASNQMDSSRIAGLVDMIGNIYETGYQSQKLLSVFEKCIGIEEERIIVYACNSIGKSIHLQNRITLELLKNSLRGTKYVKRAAYETMSRITSIIGDCWSEVINGIDDPDPIVVQWACAAAIKAGINTNAILKESTRRDVMLRALEKINNMQMSEMHTKCIARTVVDDMIESSSTRDSNIGIRILPYSEYNANEVMRILMNIIIDDSDFTKVTSALTSLRTSDQVLSQLTRKEIAVIESRLRSKHRNVRIEARRVLACFENADEVLRIFLSMDFSSLERREYVAAIYSLSRLSIAKDKVAHKLSIEIDREMGRTKKQNKKYIDKVSALLYAARVIGEPMPDGIGGRIYSLIMNYQINERLRTTAMLTYPAIVIPSRTTVNHIKQIIENKKVSIDEKAQIPGIIADNIKKSIDYVDATIACIPELQSAAAKLYSEYLSKQLTETLEQRISELRRGINSLSEIEMAFQEMHENGRCNISY